MILDSYCGDFLTASDNHTISGNTIANNMDGIGIWSGSSNEISGNSIVDNGFFGVTVVTGTRNRIVDNVIFGNGTKNIDLDYCCSPLPNNSGPGGPNNRQNYPEITAVTRNADNAVVAYILEGPAGTYRIDGYSNSSAGIPAGEVHEGIRTVTLPGGPFTFNMPLSSDNFSLTATNTSNGTSEFSPMVVLVPAVNATPRVLNFGNVTTGTSSAPRSITLTSTGTADYVISDFGNETCYGGSICYGGPFQCSTNCSTGEPYANGTQCTFTATFAPTFVGSFLSHIAVCDNATGSPRVFTLAGNAIPPDLVTISPSSDDFGSVPIGSQSGTHSFIVSNPSQGTTFISPVTTTGDFVVVSTDCPTALPAGGGCDVEVAFAPTEPGFLSGSLDVSASFGEALTAKRKAKVTKLGGGSASAALSGTGVLASQLVLPERIDLGTYSLGDSPLLQAVTLTNNSTAAIVFSNVSVAGPFTLVDGCSPSLAAGASCTLTLGFSTTFVADFSGTLNIVSSAVGGSRGIPITAHSAILPGPHIRVSPTTIGFGDRMLGSASDSQRVTITNVGNVVAAMGAITASLDFLLVNTTCGLTLAAQSTCFADVAFRPVGAGPREGELVVNSNAVDSPRVVNLAGSGCRPFSAANRSRSGLNCLP